MELKKQHGGYPRAVFFNLCKEGFEVSIKLARQIEDLKPFLVHYDIHPEYTEEISSKATKIHTNSDTYVIKWLPNTNNPLFIDAYRILKQQNYNTFVPIIKNKYNQFLTQQNGQFAYLMPWLPNETEDEHDARHQYMFKEVAAMHNRTKKEINLNGKEAGAHYETLLSHWKETKTHFEAFVDQCEQKIYLSPFELQAVTCFIEASRAIDFSIQKLKEWSEEMEGKQKTRIVLNHGKISGHHFLYDRDGTGYLTNFEYAKYSSPIDDFLLFMNRTANTYPVQCNDCVNWFYTYQKFFPYTKDEMLLFLSYLAYPNRICRIIKSYIKKSGDHSELKKTQELIKAYWQFKNIEFFVMKISEIEEHKKNQSDSDSTQE